MTARQNNLDFDAAEAANHERRNELQAKLITALRSSGADLRMTRLALRIFGAGYPRSGAPGGPLVKTYEELAEQSEYGLWCSPSAARRAANRLEEEQIIQRTEQRYVTGGQKGNAYTLDVDGIKARCQVARGLRTPAVQNDRPAVHSDHPPVQNDRPAVHSDHPPVQNDRPYKETRTSCISSSVTSKKPPPPPPEQTPCEDAETWEGVEVELIRERLTDYSTPLRKARERVTPTHVMRVLQHYRANRDKWGPGALHRRISRCHPEIAPEDNWPKSEDTATVCRPARAESERSRAEAARQDLVVKARTMGLPLPERDPWVAEQMIRQGFERALTLELCGLSEDSLPST